MKQQFPFKARHIDNGWHEIANSTAGKLAKPGGGLPKHGRERDFRAYWDGKLYTLARTVTEGRVVWSIRLVPWQEPLSLPARIPADSARWPW